MGLHTNNDLMVPARAGGYAVGAFNTSNLEITRAIFEAAEELKSPVIVATSQSAIGAPVTSVTRNVASGCVTEVRGTTQQQAGSRPARAMSASRARLVIRLPTQTPERGGPCHRTAPPQY